MAKQNKIIEQVFELDVTTAEGTTKGSFQVDKNADKILGIALSSSRDDIVYYRGTQLIKINDEEFIPEGYETKRLMCGINVPLDDRYRTFKEPITPGNRKVEIVYTDNANEAADFAVYKIFLYVYSLRTPEVSQS